MPFGTLYSAPEITALKSCQDGLTYAVGTSTGHVLLFDLRRPTPLLVKDHQYGYPIKSLHFHSSGNVLSADTKIVKIWNQHSGNVFTNVEPSCDINDTLIDDKSGLLMIANEGSPVQTFYIPALGPAPKWCPFLDNLTEELEESPNQPIYDDYKFLTRKDLSKLNLEHLIGTNLLKPYMHGFFVDLRLYEKARAISNPFDYDEYRQKQIEKKIDNERSSRIAAKKKLPKVNAALAKRFMETKDSVSKKAASAATNVLEDGRFSSLFQDPEFQVDEESQEFLLHHPNQNSKRNAMDSRNLSEPESD